MNRNPFIAFNDLSTILKFQMDRILINFEKKQKNITETTDIQINTPNVKYPIVPHYGDRPYLLASR